MSIVGICTPEGSFIQLNHIHRTRSGRAVKPQLAWWMGQKLVLNEKDDSVLVDNGTAHAQEVLSNISHMHKVTEHSLKRNNQ